MRVLPVQSHASAPASAPAAGAQPASTSSAAVAGSFQQVLNKSAKAKQPPPNQAPSTAASGKKTNGNSAATSQTTEETEENGAAAAAGGKAPAPVTSKTPAKTKAGDAVKSDSDSEEDAESQPVNVDAEQAPALGEEKSSSPDDEKESTAEKSKQKPAATTTTDTSSAAAVALNPDVYVPQPIQTLAAKTDGGAAENVAAKPVKSNVAATQSKGTKLQAEEAVQPAKGKSADQPKDSSGSAASDALASVDSAAAGEVAAAAGSSAAPKTAEHSASPGDFAAVQQQAADAVAQKAAVVTKTAIPQPPALATDAQIAAANNRQIVTAVHTQLLPNGGSMQIRLDPPELGALQITVHMRDGMMTAEFAASNDQAASLLSHSLGDLKSQLETQGVSVEKLHVTQAPRSTSGGKSDSGDRSRRDGDPTEDQRREQQRREMIQRMWSKLAGEPVPLDMVA
jgi:flagellar hook-length control protein FliK